MLSSRTRAAPQAKRRRIRRNGVAHGFRRWLKRAGWAWRKLSAAPRTLRVGVVTAVLLVLFAVVNLVYQVARKPTEMFFPMSGALNKSPAETWRQYAPLFREYATAAITPELLAALAQAEGAGNPVARTYWRWQLTWHPLAIYKPASSAVGMYQMTDAAFAEARRYCIQRHAVAEESCWFRGLYTRILPSHAVELTSVYLDRGVAAILADRAGTVRPQQQQDLATIIHLCGAGPAKAFAHRGFHLASGERCGDHDVSGYLGEVNGLKVRFARLARGE
jgi:hypothetical protein